MNLVQKICNWVLAAVATLLLLTVLYVGVAWLLTIIPANASYVAPAQGITIYVQTNGVHTDFTVPVKHPLKDWSVQIDKNDFTEAAIDFKYISFGWGDRGFYLETPTWADLQASVAVNALLLPSRSAMHVTYDMAPPSPAYSRSLVITPHQYQELINFIEASFAKDSSGRFILIKGYSYAGYYNNFYEAQGDYHLFYTSNNWTNRGLKKIGVKTATWAPLDWCVFYHL